MENKPTMRQYMDMVEYMQSKLNLNVETTNTRGFIEAREFDQGGVVLYYNYDEGQVKYYGEWEVINFTHAERWFEKPLEPTEFELELHRLEFGKEYLLSKYLR